MEGVLEKTIIFCITFGDAGDTEDLALREQWKENQTLLVTEIEK